MAEAWEYSKPILEVPGFIGDFCRGCKAGQGCPVDHRPYDVVCRRHKKWACIEDAIEMAVL